MDYFATAVEQAREHAAQTVRDAQVTKLTRQYMTNSDHRADCVIDVLENCETSQVAIAIEELIYGTPSVKAEARRRLQDMIESAAMAYARGQI